LAENKLELLKQTAKRGQYAPLYRQLVELTVNEWPVTFSEIEKLLGFKLPPSAHIHRPWWANGGSHSHSLSWEAAGWATSKVDMAGEKLVFVRATPMAHEAHGRPRPDDNQGKDVGITDEEWKDAINKIGARNLNTQWTHDEIIKLVIDNIRRTRT
jgi:hypothetical protein